MVISRGHIDKTISAYTSCCVCNKFNVIFALLIVEWIWIFFGVHLFLDDKDVVRRRLSAAEIADQEDWG